MNEFKGTPGPWLTEQTTIYAMNNEPVPVNRFTVHVDRGWGDNGERISQQEVAANARLIAAAPELLAAALRVLAKLEHPTAGVTIFDEEALRAAVDKATSNPNQTT